MNKYNSPNTYIDIPDKFTPEQVVEKFENSLKWGWTKNPELYAQETRQYKDLVELLPNLKVEASEKGAKGFFSRVLGQQKTSLDVSNLHPDQFSILRGEISSLLDSGRYGPFAKKNLILSSVNGKIVLPLKPEEAHKLLAEVGNGLAPIIAEREAEFVQIERRYNAVIKHLEEAKAAVAAAEKAAEAAGESVAEKGVREVLNGELPGATAVEEAYSKLSGKNSGLTGPELVASLEENLRMDKFDQSTRVQFIETTNEMIGKKDAILSTLAEETLKGGGTQTTINLGCMKNKSKAIEFVDYLKREIASRKNNISVSGIPGTDTIIIPLPKEEVESCLESVNQTLVKRLEIAEKLSISANAAIGELENDLELARQGVVRVGAPTAPEPVAPQGGSVEASGERAADGMTVAAEGAPRPAVDAAYSELSGRYPDLDGQALVSHLENEVVSNNLLIGDSRDRFGTLEKFSELLPKIKGSLSSVSNEAGRSVVEINLNGFNSQQVVGVEKLLEESGVAADLIQSNGTRILVEAPQAEVEAALDLLAEAAPRQLEELTSQMASLNAQKTRLAEDLVQAQSAVGKVGELAAGAVPVGASVPEPAIPEGGAVAPHSNPEFELVLEDASERVPVPADGNVGAKGKPGPAVPAPLETTDLHSDYDFELVLEDVPDRVAASEGRPTAPAEMPFPEAPDLGPAPGRESSRDLPSGFYNTTDEVAVRTEAATTGRSWRQWRTEKWEGMWDRASSLFERDTPVFSQAAAERVQASAGGWRRKQCRRGGMRLRIVPWARWRRRPWRRRRVLPGWAGWRARRVAARWKPGRKWPRWKRAGWRWAGCGICRIFKICSSRLKFLYVSSRWSEATRDLPRLQAGKTPRLRSG